jgi:hypothetical protein
MLRKTVSLTAFASFLVLLASSVVLYFEPHGRVAYWGDWRFLGLSKPDWDQIHLGVGTLFLGASLLHLWLNWKPLMAYLKNKARQWSPANPAFLVALALTAYCTVGSVAGLPVVRQVLGFSATLKDSHTATYGNPPYGHAELSPLERFTSMLGLDPDEAVAALAAAGITGASRTSVLADLARENATSPQKLYEIILAALSADPFASLPPQPPEGTGKMSLEQFGASYGLPWEDLAGRLAALGIQAGPRDTLKQAAEKAGLDPRELYSRLRGGAE